MIASRRNGPWRRGRVLGLAVLVYCVLRLGACSSPPPKLYTIAPVPGSTSIDAPKVVVVREVSLAPYLQQPPIIRSTIGYRLNVMSNDWWGEAPAAMLTRVLVENLNQRLRGSTVLGENGAVGTRADATLEVNISRLDEDADGKLVLEAQAAVDTRARKAPRPRIFQFTVTPPSADVGGEVAAISAAIGQLSDDLAAMLASR